MTHRLRELVARSFALGLFLASGPALANQSPVIDGLTATSTVVAPGGTVTVTVEAHDPDCPDTCTSGCGQYVRGDLTQWSATGGTLTNEVEGVSGSPFSASIDWQAPSTEATYTVTVIVYDSGSFFCGGRLDATADLDIQVTTVQNEPPVVESLTADPLQLFPGGTSDLTCVASDPNDDPLTYSWEADSGTIVPGTPGTAVFTADQPGAVSVTCTVTDPDQAPGSDTVILSVTSAVAEKAIGAGLVAPQRLSIDSTGNVYVVDAAAGGLTVVHLLTGEPVYRLPLTGLRSVAVDWNDHLLIGGTTGAAILDREGQALLQLDPGESLGEVVDVAVDLDNRLYGVLHGKSGRVVVYDEYGTEAASFGGTGDGAEQFKSPEGLAVDPTGNWVVADGGHGQIKVFDGAGTLVSTFGGLGGGVGEFVKLDDVAVDDAGVIYASDSFQDWIQTFNPDGTPREVLGTYGNDPGQFRTVAGIEPAPAFDRLLAASVNSSSLQVFVTSAAPTSTGPAPSASVEPAGLVFDPQAVGTVSDPLIVGVTNTGNAPLGIREIATPVGFTESHDCPFVDPGLSCAIQVRFAPATIGGTSGSMALDTSAASGTLTVDLSGIGFAPADVVLSPAELDFSDQEVGTISVPKTITLLNPGSVALSLYGIESIGSFVQGNDCGASVPGGTGCSIDVRFTPGIVADHILGTIRVDSSAVGSPHAAELEGRGIPGFIQITVDDASTSEGDGEPVELVFPVALSRAADDIIHVDYQTVADSAAEGEDFQPVSGTLTFLEGETSADVSVPVLGDVILEPLEESLFLQLSDPSNAELSDDSALGTIVDDERCPGPNLLVNGGAEAIPDGAGIPGWTASTGSEWMPRGAPPDPYEGEAYFFADGTPLAKLTQDVDLSPYATAIAAGEQRFAFEGRIRTLDETPSDTARIVVEYRDRDNTKILDTFDSGELSDPAEWLRVADERPAPAGTGWIRVLLISKRESGTSNDAYFDALVLRSLRTVVVEPDDAAAYEGQFGTTGIAFPVTLNCRNDRQVRLDYATADGTALAGEDYLATTGSVSISAGGTATSIPVQLIGDVLDEGHETFSLAVQVEEPELAVIVDGEAEGTIVNDDSCPKPKQYWNAFPDLWPLSELSIGGVVLEKSQLIELLERGGRDVSIRLAQELVATKLNLAMGSDPAILPTVEDADAFLEQYPPGSDVPQFDKQVGQDLFQALKSYNESCGGE